MRARKLEKNFVKKGFKLGFKLGLGHFASYKFPKVEDLPTQRLQTALRLLLRAYQRLYTLGRLTEPIELLLCPNETPVNIGGWCVEGPQPIFSSTTNEHAALIPFAQWLIGPDRDADLAWWNPMRRKPVEVSDYLVAGTGLRWADKEPRAVFRGSVHRLSVYTDEWRSRGPARTQVTSKNWRQLGRTALLDAKTRRPDLFNMRLAWKSVEAHEGLSQVPD